MDLREALKKFRAFAIRGFVHAVGAASRAFSRLHKNEMSGIMVDVCKAMETDDEYFAFQVRPKDTASIPILGG